MSTSSLHQMTAEADQFYADRQDITNVSKSIEILRKADADCYEIAWRLSRALFFAGQQSPDAKKARDLHASGVEAGKRAARVHSERVEGHFWLGVNLALLARLEPPIKALAHALQAKRALLSAIAIDPSYHGAGPLRVLARLQHKLPRLLGGGTLRARANFELAIAIASSNTVTRIYFAELLWDIGEMTRARAELEQVLSAPFDPDWAFEIERDQYLAKEMIKKVSRNSTLIGK